MRPWRDGIARPLLGIGRAETAAICVAAGITPREDPSNRSVRFARNRVRLRVLPELERINPQVRAALARFADAAADLETAAIAEPEHGHESQELDVRTLPLDRAPRIRRLAEAWRAATSVTLTARQRDALMSLASSTAGSRGVDLPGGRAVREYARLLLPSASSGHSTPPSASSARTPSASATTRPAAPSPLERGTSILRHGWRIALDMPSDGLAYSGLVDSDTASHLVVRARRPGDRVPKGGKIQDLFVDAKVPARLRDSWPILALGEAVLWVPGLTPTPRTGRIRIEAGPVADRTGPGEGPARKYLSERQVASKSVARRQGGKRGRP
jgi:tRNA(Ile)-lysidine synthetase-like protein